ncbi:importin subunit alpha-2-like [Manihot esculenta]|uniref:importin subunit alpha-2-like n=1 Tax=Manihot esculenta TaxID=3983 RepID=UPI001CC344CB|nr:importin subunit alpha-2-like [Manihot esculenta]
MSLRPSASTEAQRNKDKVAVDAEEGRRRTEDNMVEIQKDKREENLQKKGREGLQSPQQQLTSSISSSPADQSVVSSISSSSADQSVVSSTSAATHLLFLNVGLATSFPFHFILFTRKQE